MNPSVATNVKRKFNVTTVVAQYLLIRREKKNSIMKKIIKKCYFLLCIAGLLDFGIS